MIKAKIIAPILLKDHSNPILLKDHSKLCCVVVSWLVLLLLLLSPSTLPPLLLSVAPSGPGSLFLFLFCLMIRNISILVIWSRSEKYSALVP